MRRIIFMALVGILLVLRPATAQSSDPHQVFLTTPNQITFVDLQTGALTPVNTNGDRFTILRDAVMFYDRTSRRVMLATPDGAVTPHPFIQPGDGVNRIDWHISPDEAMVAWTETRGAPSTLTTTTWVASGSGGDIRQVFTDGPRDGIRAYPLAFSDDNAVLYMDYQPDTIGDLTPFRQYAGLFAVDLNNGETRALPGEPGCFCGAGIGASTLLRMIAGQSGYSLRIHNLSSATDTILPPVNNFTQGGDVLIAPDGASAVYSLAQITGFGTDTQSIQTVIVLVDLLSLTQRPLTEPANRLLRPVAWTEDDSAVLLSAPASMTTWKVTIRDGALEQVAAGVYLGTLSGG